MTFLVILMFILSYLSGSLCSAIILSKALNLPDPRTEGSKNPGATNVLRLAGKKYALMVFFFDSIKGFIPIIVGKLLGLSPVTLSFLCFAAVLGHMFPVFYRFHGGKGIATAIGSLLAFHLILGTLVIATWLIVANFTRYSSVASLASMLFMPLFAGMLTGNIEIVPPFIFIALLVLYKHRNNLTRLMDGTEPQIGNQAPILEPTTQAPQAPTAPHTEVDTPTPQANTAPARDEEQSTREAIEEEQEILDHIAKPQTNNDK